MNRKKQFYFLTFALLGLLSLFLYSCLNDEMNSKNEENVDDAARLQEIREAREFFENHVASIPPNADPQGIYPGNFATDWDNATYIVNTDDSIISLNACIIPEYYYEGDLAKDYTQTPETDDDWYHTAISQKIVSLKDMRTGARCCYILTLIPDASCATKSRAEIDWLFNNGDNQGNQFSGLAIYSTVEENRTLVVDRYGQHFARASVFGKSTENEYASLIGAAKYTQFKLLRTKYELDEVVVTAPYPGGSTIIIVNTRPGTTPNIPSDNSNYPPTGGSGGGGGNSGGNSGGNNTNGNSSILPNKSVTYAPSRFEDTGGYIKGTCNCMCMAQKIMKQILGNNANIGSSANVKQLWKEMNGVLTKVGDAKDIFNTLNDHLSSNHPIIVGVDHTANKHPGNSDKTTDHFIVITGRGYDSSTEQYYYNYVETGRTEGKGIEATSSSNRLYYNSSAGTFIDSNTYNKKEYRLTQIRPNL
ncbi:hypothetical protein AGMMS50262_20860 [Bacteroidia bacterium]|nr:hypothetical protein AGMMS50262_20860 [Bacteroidia bacterium]